jgi:[FeFe] hydrogenase H-cluster maturation GTPase HydF
MRVFNRTEIGVLVAEAQQWGEFEEEILKEFSTRNIPAIVVFNKIDVNYPPDALVQKLTKEKISTVFTVASKGKGISEFREALLQNAPDELMVNRPIIRDLVGPGEMAMLVIPVDKEAPKGRLILPQVQTIRDLLDGEAYCMVVQEGQLEKALNQLKTPPKLVVTDSQAFVNVATITPEDVPLTGFSVLFSRLKGDLRSQVRGAVAIDRLKPGDRILVAEACTHHPIGEDIGRIKIPKWLRDYVGGELHFDTVAGKDWPEDVSSYQLVIHCGACTFNRKATMSRILQCEEQGTPITNYGLAIAFSQGILDRALQPFPEVFEEYLKSCGKKP